LFHTPVKSSNLKSVAYENVILEVTFQDNRTYQYYDVEVDKYNSLLNASSKGSYLDKHIKKGGYRYKRVR